MQDPLVVWLRLPIKSRHTILRQQSSYGPRARENYPPNLMARIRKQEHHLLPHFTSKPTFPRPHTFSPLETGNFSPPRASIRWAQLRFQRPMCRRKQCSLTPLSRMPKVTFVEPHPLVAGIMVVTERVKPWDTPESHEPEDPHIDNTHGHIRVPKPNDPAHNTGRRGRVDGCVASTGAICQADNDIVQKVRGSRKPFPEDPLPCSSSPHHQ